MLQKDIEILQVNSRILHDVEWIDYINFDVSLIPNYFITFLQMYSKLMLFFYANTYRQRVSNFILCVHVYKFNGVILFED